MCEMIARLSVYRENVCMKEIIEKKKKKRKKKSGYAANLKFKSN